MPNYRSAAETAHRLGISKTLLLMRVKENRVVPPPMRVSGNANAQWLFAPNARVVTPK
jgi:hypothetical protein